MTSQLRIATFNVLADSYTGYGDYSHAPANLMQPGGRTQPLVALINQLGADVVGLQEAERPLVGALAASGRWQTLWSQKQDAPDGCLTLVRNDLAVDNLDVMHYGDGSGHVAQILQIGKITIGNTHIKWNMTNRIAQTEELLARVATKPHAVLLGDFNDRPGEPARKLVAEAGYTNVAGDVPTAYISNRDGATAIDLFAVRGLQAAPMLVNLGEGFDIQEIPSNRCPSDHIPVMAQVALP